MRVALYIRVSSEEQAVHGLSIEAQTEALTAWAEEKHAYVVGRYVDAGISARKKASKRPELQRLLEDVRNGDIDLIVFTKLDRWFRNIAEYYKVQEILEAYHVNWKTIQEDYDTSTASGRLKVNIMLSVAQDEADRTGERIKAVHESKLLRNEPISGKVPFGYKIENKRLVIVPEDAEKVRDIFRQYIALRSIRSLRVYVLEKHGLSYGQTGLAQFLKNERYIGRAHGKDDFCPAILDKTVFYQAQDILKIRAQRVSYNRTDRVYLFTGILFCAECGNRLSAHVVRQKYIYYRCTHYEKFRECGHKKRTSEMVLEDWLLNNFVSQCAAYNAALEAETTEKPVVNVQAIKNKMEKLKDLYLNDLIQRDTYENEYNALRTELEKATGSIRQPRKPVDLQAIADSLNVYSHLSRQGKKEFWSRVIKRIDITNDDQFFVTPISP